MTTEEVWKLDESKLQQADLDRKELYLFQWLSNLEKTLQTAPRVRQEDGSLFGKGWDPPFPLPQLISQILHKI